MARGRMLNQTIDYDPEFNALSVEAQLMYLRTLAFLDRDGLIFGHPRALLAKVAPLLDLSQIDVIDIITEWVEQGLVIRYTLKVGDVLFFKGFAKNQSGMHYDRESPSRFDPPPGWTHGPKGLVACGPLPNRIDSEPTPTETTNEAQTESGDTPTEDESNTQTNSGGTPAELRQESGESPPQIEVKDQIEEQDQQLQGDEEEDPRVRDPVGDAWRDCYAEEIPGNLKVRIGNLVTECGSDAVVYAVEASKKADARNFRYIAQCARNYIPPAPTTYANGNSYAVDIPGVVHLQPQARPPTPPPKLPPPMPTDDPWAIALGELLPTLPGSAPRWLEGSYLLDNGELAGEPFYRVVLTCPHADPLWLQNRVEPVIRKKLASILGKRISLEFVVMERVQP